MDFYDGRIFVRMDMTTTATTTSTTSTTTTVVHYDYYCTTAAVFIIFLPKYSVFVPIPFLIYLIEFKFSSCTASFVLGASQLGGRPRTCHGVIKAFGPATRSLRSACFLIVTKNLFV